MDVWKASQKLEVPKSKVESGREEIEYNLVRKNGPSKAWESLKNIAFPENSKKAWKVLGRK